MDATENNSDFRRFTGAMRATSLRRAKSMASQKADVMCERIDSGLTDSDEKKSESHSSEDKIDLEKIGATFGAVSQTTTSGSQSPTQNNEIQRQGNLGAGQTNVGSSTTTNDILGGAEAECLDPDMKLASATTQIANCEIKEAFNCDPAMTVEDVDVTTITDTMKAVGEKEIVEMSRPPVEAQIDKIETKVHLETKAEVMKIVAASAIGGAGNTMSKKGEKGVLEPARAQWRLKLTPKNTKDPTKKAKTLLIKLYHKGELLPGSLPVGISSKNAGSSRLAANLMPGRRY